MPAAWSTTASPQLVGHVDVALAQHVLPFPAGQVGTRPGPALSAADSMRITVHGRGAHGSMPQAAVDPVVLAAMIVVRLQTVVSREVAPTEPAVLTVGSIQAGTKSNVIGDHAVLELNVRTYNEQTRTHRPRRHQAHRHAPNAQASGRPREPEFELFDRFPPTDQRPRDHRPGRARHSPTYFGDRARSSRCRPPARTSATSLTRSACPTPTGASAASTPTPTAGRTAGGPGRPGHPGQPLRRLRAGRSNPPSTPAPQALVVAALAWLAAG